MILSNEAFIKKIVISSIKVIHNSKNPSSKKKKMQLRSTFGMHSNQLFIAIRIYEVYGQPYGKWLVVLNWIQCQIIMHLCLKRRT
jgi:hypothetical protein